MMVFMHLRRFRIESDRKGCRIGTEPHVLERMLVAELGFKRTEQDALGSRFVRLKICLSAMFSSIALE